MYANRIYFKKTNYAETSFPYMALIKETYGVDIREESNFNTVLMSKFSSLLATSRIDKISMYIKNYKYLCSLLKKYYTTEQINSIILSNFDMLNDEKSNIFRILTKSAVVNECDLDKFYDNIKGNDEVLSNDLITIGNLALLEELSINNKVLEEDFSLLAKTPSTTNAAVKMANKSNIKTVLEYKNILNSIDLEKAKKSNSIQNKELLEKANNYIINVGEKYSNLNNFKKVR